MRLTEWEHPWRRWRGRGLVQTDLTSYRQIAEGVGCLGERLRDVPTAYFETAAARLRRQAGEGTSLDDLLPETFALTREIAHRVIGMRPFHVQIMAGVALHCEGGRDGREIPARRVSS